MTLVMNTTSLTFSDEVSVDLFRQLLHSNESYSIPMFHVKKLNALVALAVHSTTKVVGY